MGSQATSPPVVLKLRRAWSGAALLSTLVFACGSSYIPHESKTMTAYHQDLKITASLSEDKNVLTLTYKARNTAQYPVFLFNILHDDFSDTGNYIIFQNYCYSVVKTDRIVFSLKIIEVPADKFVEKPNIPFVTRLLPGEDIEAACAVLLPVRTVTPYTYDGLNQETGAIGPLPVYFELGYFVEQPGTLELLEQFPTNHGEVPGFYPFPAESQKTVRIGPLANVSAVLLPR